MRLNLQHYMDVISGAPKSHIIAQAFKIILQDPDLLSILRCGGPSFQSKRHNKFDKKLRQLFEPYTNYEQRPYIIPMLSALIEGFAVWAVREENSNMDEMAHALQNFVENGLSQ